MPAFKVTLSCDVRYTRTVEIDADDEESAIDEAEAEFSPDGDFDEWEQHDWMNNATEAEELDAGDDEDDDEEEAPDNVFLVAYTTPAGEPTARAFSTYEKAEAFRSMLGRLAFAGVVESAIDSDVAEG